MEFSGTLLLVSHDRDFLDNVVTSTLVAEGDGKWTEYVGGYSDYVADRTRNASPGSATPTTKAKSSWIKKKTPKPRRLNGKEKQELAELPAKIEALETEQETLTTKLADPEFYANEADKVPALKARLEAIEAETLEVFARWEELDAIQNASEV